MKIKAAVLTAINAPLEMLELEVPRLESGQVLVQVHYAAICQTQINELRGRKGPDKFIPHTLGHEGSGTVLEVGSGVSTVRPGDNVVLTWLRCPGMNVAGSKYASGSRVVNSGAVSTFMTHAVVSENRVFPLDGVPSELMPLFGCALPTGAGMVLNTLRPRKGESIAVFGVGGVGACVVMAASACGCNPIIAVDLHTKRIEAATELGATHVVAASSDVVSEVLMLSGGQGVDFCVECAGKIEAIEAGIACVRKGGGKLLIAGNPPHGEKVSLDPFDLISGKQIQGSWGGEAVPERDFAQYKELFVREGQPLSRLITHRVNLDDINRGVGLMESGESVRVLVDCRSH